MGSPDPGDAPVSPTAIEEPTAVLAVTVRTSDRGTARTEAAAALRECAARLGLEADGALLEVAHADPAILELCLKVGRLPAEDPPAPVAAELLTPGTMVEIEPTSGG